MTTVGVTDLSAFYGQAQALFDITLELRAEEIVAVLGHNGAGKSTLLASIAGLHRGVRGRIELEGEDIVGLGPSGVARRGVSFVREGAPVFAHLSVEENLRLGTRLAQLRDREPTALADVWEWFPVLGERRRATAGVLSGGQRQMLALSQALVSRPDVLLLDEPSAGLAPTMAESVFAAVRALCASGMSVLLAEQDTRWVQGFASRYYYLETGRVDESRDLGTADHASPAELG